MLAAETDRRPRVFGSVQSFSVGAEMLLLLALAQHDAVAAAVFAPIAIGVNGHPFTQPNYMVGADFVVSGSAAGISYEEQLDTVAALAPGDGSPFFYRVDLACGNLLGTTSHNATQGALATAATGAFVRAAAVRNLTVLPILFPDLGNAAYTDHAAVTAAAQTSLRRCARVLVDLGITRFEIGQEWDNVALLPGRGGDKVADYNQTVYTHLLAVLRGMAAGVRAACSEASAPRQCEIGVNTGGWVHWMWLEMLLQDKLDVNFVAYHWYSEMGDINSAGGEDVWAKLVSFGKDIWITELDRRGGSSARAPCTHPICSMDQPTYLRHEIELLVSLSKNASNLLKAIFVYELYDEPHQGNSYPQTCATGNTSTNGESCYGLVSTSWAPGSPCDQYPSCTFTAAKRKPAFQVIQALAKQLSTRPPPSHSPVGKQLPKHFTGLG